MLKKSILFTTLVCSVFAGDIKIALAANVSYAIEDLKKEFHKLYPDTRVKVTLSGSGKLTAQIKYGAPYQLFMSANMKYPEALYADKIAVTKPVIYAQGSLAYFSIKKHDFSRGMELLEDKKISKIAIVNPKTAPYGKAAFEAMENSNILNNIKHKFIYGESISQAVSYAVTAADIGLIAKSSLYSIHMTKYKKGINWGAVDSKLYTPIDQGIVILKEGKDSAEVRAFYDFILSPQARAIFERFGYIVP
ncbi:MAG TPA: molybdate ABC transporter substrate-binding protein [Sulfurovum sp.]|nr:molybdate ABC transporter substrate-binding protein [Sulfurovum sp.]